MILQTLKRGIKKRLFERDGKKFSITSFTATLALISTVVFCITQLSINADLNPKGVKLESLNEEKNLLIEDNRQMEKDIADSESIPVITDIAQTKLNLKDNPDQKTIFISDPGIIASTE